MRINDYWYKNAFVYAVDVKSFMDGDGDGIGDFEGLTARLDYLDRLGVDCLWLLPFYPSPGRDNGYDVVDHYGVDPRLGSLGDFVELLRRAHSRGMRVIVDLVVNHTSDQHPWFREARADPGSKYRDYYVWTDEPTPPRPGKENAFPGEEGGGRIWTYDEAADAYYYHRFYDFQPDLDTRNPDVHEEIRKIMGFWLELGVDGFRVDAATHMIEDKRRHGSPAEGSHDILREMRTLVSRFGDEAILLAEANDSPNKLASYFGDGDEMTMLLNFLLDAYLALAFVRGEAEPIEHCLSILPEIPTEGAWANFLRNFDELNIGRLPPAEKEEVFEAWAPDEGMRLYGRGIRRRLAPLLDGDRERIELAYSLLFSLPGTPLLFYGDELGMGDDLSRPGREAVRTPMQWSAEENAGFSTADPEELIRPVIASGEFGYDRVNVERQRPDPDSLLSWMERLIGTRKECPEIGRGTCSVVGIDDPAVLVHRCDYGETSVVTAHNLAGESRSVELDLGDEPHVLFGDALVSAGNESITIDLDGHGYCWFRLGRRQGPAIP